MKSKIKKLPSLALAVISLLSIFQNATAQDTEMKKKEKEKMKSMEDLKSWPMASKMAVTEQINLYGKPNEMTATMAVWYHNGSWEKTVISKMENKHDFPVTHNDCMEQCINYKVPLDKYDELAHFDGSVTVDRTQGTLAARCDKEENNFLALNLAHDIITGNKSVEEARKSYGEMIKQAMSGNKPEYMKKLQFSPSKNAPDPDMNTIDKM